MSLTVNCNLLQNMAHFVARMRHVALSFSQQHNFSPVLFAFMAQSAWLAGFEEPACVYVGVGLLVIARDRYGT